MSRGRSGGPSPDNMLRTEGVVSGEAVTHAPVNISASNAALLFFWLHFHLIAWRHGGYRRSAAQCAGAGRARAIWCRPLILMAGRRAA